MSYLHCPTCQRAYNLATDPLCPYCPVPATQVDPTEDIVAAAEQLARAMARATPSERTAATSRLDMLALPAPNAKPVTFHGGMLRSIREALEPVELRRRRSRSHCSPRSPMRWSSESPRAPTGWCRVLARSPPGPKTSPRRRRACGGLPRSCRASVHSPPRRRSSALFTTSVVIRRPLSYSTRHPLAPVVLPVAALVASLIRWQVQGSHNLYTAFEKRFYVPDPDLGWRVSTQHPIWLGLDTCAVIAALAVAVAILGSGPAAAAPREPRSSNAASATAARATGLRVASWILAAIPLAVPVMAFASGPGPLHGRDTLPPERRRACRVRHRGLARCAGRPLCRRGASRHLDHRAPLRRRRGV